MPHLLSSELSRCNPPLHPTAAAAAGTAPLTWPPWPHTADTMTGSTLPSEQTTTFTFTAVKIISHHKQTSWYTNIKNLTTVSHITEKTPKLNKVPFIYMHYQKNTHFHMVQKKKRLRYVLLKWYVAWEEAVGFFFKLKQGVKCFTFQHVMCRSP